MFSLFKIESSNPLGYMSLPDKECVTVHYGSISFIRRRAMALARRMACAEDVEHSQQQNNFDDTAALLRKFDK